MNVRKVSISTSISRGWVLFLFVFLSICWNPVRGQFGYGMNDAIPVPTTSCYFTDYQYTPYFFNAYGFSSPEVWYTLTLDSWTEVEISLCGSDFDTYLWLTDSYGNGLYYDDDGGCDGTSKIQRYLGPGTYYIVAEGYGSHVGNLQLTAIIGTPSEGATMTYAVSAGSFSSIGGTFTDVRSNIDECLGNNIGQSSNEIYYEFILTAEAEVKLSHCGSGFDTYMHLLNGSGNTIITNDDGLSQSPCPGSQAYIQTTLAAGTYYVVSEGYSWYTGNIVTSITVLPSTSGLAPVIAYGSPGTYNVGTVISPLIPSNTGGAVSSGAQATTFAGSGSTGMAMVRQLARPLIIH